MKKYILLTIWGAMFLYGLPTIAKPYYLHSSIGNNGQKVAKGSKAPKRPLYVDLTDNTLTIPSSTMGYTLVFKDREEVLYICIITNNTIVLPFENLENFELLIIGNNNTYTCIL